YLESVSSTISALADLPRAASCLVQLGWRHPMAIEPINSNQQCRNAHVAWLRGVVERQLREWQPPHLHAAPSAHFIREIVQAEEIDDRRFDAERCLLIAKSVRENVDAWLETRLSELVQCGNFPRLRRGAQVRQRSRSLALPVVERLSGSWVDIEIDIDIDIEA